MEVLFEIHDEESIDKLPVDARIVGINNRNLRNFDVSIEQSMKLADKLPKGVTKLLKVGSTARQPLLNCARPGLMDS
jgi:indole-3-glycerol phosphate synthase